MATKEQIQRIFQKMQECHPAELFRCMDDTKAGLGAVLRILYTAKEPVTAGMISEKMGISTARVAVLLKKLEAKGLIIKEHAARDARVTRVRLTEHGAEMILEWWDKICERMGNIIDRIGEERLLEYIEIGNEIRQIMSAPPESFDR